MIWQILGTRPEALKQLPLSRLFAAQNIPYHITVTGQHTDLLSGTGLDEYEIKRHSGGLGLPSQNDPEQYVNDCVAELHRNTEALPTADLILVQGDTASALAGALYGRDKGIPVGHIEAGLRSGDLNDPWPEEGFRRRIDEMSQFRYCPTVQNLDTLKSEGLDGFVTGNTVTDALRLAKVAARGVAKRESGPVLITLHRRESFGERLWEIAAGIAAAANRHPGTAFCWPVHPNPKVQEVAYGMTFPPNVMKRGPLPYAQFVEFLSYARAVVTDSGGLVEECTTLGIPCAVARKTTERPEACEVGSAKLVGTDAQSVSAGIDWALESLWTVKPSTVFGDGYAARKILALIRRDGPKFACI